MHACQLWAIALDRDAASMEVSIVHPTTFGRSVESAATHDGLS